MRWKAERETGRASSVNRSPRALQVGNLSSLEVLRLDGNALGATGLPAELGSLNLP